MCSQVLSFLEKKNPKKLLKLDHSYKKCPIVPKTIEKTNPKISINKIYLLSILTNKYLCYNHIQEGVIL